MTAVRTRPAASAAAADPRGTARWALWPVAASTICMPVAYFLGLGAVVWLAPALALGGLVLRQRSIRVPWSALPLIGLILWIPVTVVSVGGAGSVAVFVYRWLLWVAMLGALLWMCNTSERRVPTARVVDLLASLWVVLVGFGYLALVFPYVAVASPFGRLLPGAVAGNVFVSDLTIIRFAELQRFAGGAVPRPAAPMIATNGWGSTVAILTPFFIVSFLLAGERTRRRWGWALVVAAIPPLAVSTDRGAWLSLGVGLLYVACRLALRGSARPLGAIVASVVLAVAVVVATPLGGVVQARLDGAGASNDTRASLYTLAWDRAQQQPVIGYGETIDNAPDPPIGTHGLVWYALVAHGFPGLMLLLLAVASFVAASFRARTRTALWSHAAILIFAVQLPFYGLLPQIVVIGFAAGICWREDHPGVLVDG